MIPVLQFRTNFHIEHKCDENEDFKPMVEFIALVAKPKYTFPDCKEIKKEFEVTEQRMFLERKHIAYFIETLKKCDAVLERDEHYMNALMNTIEKDKEEEIEQNKNENQ